MLVREHGPSRYRRARLIVVALSGLLVALIAAPASAMSTVSLAGVVSPEIVVSESDLVVELDPGFEANRAVKAREGAIGAIEQEVQSDQSELGAFRPASRLESHGSNSTLSTAGGGAVGSSRQQYHYLDDNLDLSSSPTLKQAVRYDHHQFLSDDYGPGDASADKARVRYDHRQFLRDDDVDASLSNGVRSAQSDEMRFLEENWYYGTSNRPDERALLIDEIRFLEDNWHMFPSAADSADAGGQLVMLSPDG